MADSTVVGLPAATTLAGTEVTPVAQGGTTYKATITQLRTQGGNLIAASGTAGQIEFGAVGPAGEPGTRWGLTGDAVIYLDGQGVSYNQNGVKRFTMRNVGTPPNNFSFGLNSLLLATSGASNTALGQDALAGLNTGSFNVAIGRSALMALTSGNNNTAAGLQALASNLSGSNNTAVGYQALQSATSSRNTAIGSQALQSVTSSSDNTAVGFHAGQLTTSGNVTVIGSNAGSNLVGNYDDSVTIGANAAVNIAPPGSAYQTVTIGADARGSASGFHHQNVAIGYRAMYLSTAGVQSVAIGSEALYSQTTGSDQSVGIGYQALRSLTSGSSNTAAGHQAGYTDVPANATTTGSQNTFIGSQSGQSSAAQRSNTVAVGFRAKVDGDYAVAIGANTLAGAAGSVAIGTDSTGTGASTATTNQIALGTPSHIVRFVGKAQVQAGASGQFAKVGGHMLGSVITAGNVGAGETTINSLSIPANTLLLDGQKLYVRYYGDTADNAATKQLRVKYGATTVLDTGAFSDTGAASWMIEVDLIRDSNTTARAICTFTSFNTNTAVVTTYTAIAGLNHTSTAQTLAVTGQATSNDDVVCRAAHLEWYG